MAAPQNVQLMQQGPTDGAKPMLIMATPPQGYLHQSAPPSYASSPEAFIVAGNQQTPPVAGLNPAPQAVAGSPQVAGGNQVNNPPAVVVANSNPAQRPADVQVASNPENWQKF